MCRGEFMSLEGMTDLNELRIFGEIPIKQFFTLNFDSAICRIEE